MVKENEEERLKRPIGQVIRTWREYRSLETTQLAANATEFAESDGPSISKSYISQLELGRIRNPGNEFITPIARALNIPLSYLITKILPGEESHSSPIPQQNMHPSTAVFAAPVSLGDKERKKKDSERLSYGEQIEKLVAEFDLPYGKRLHAWRLILEAAHGICKVIKEEE